MNLNFLVRVVFEVGDSGDEESVFLEVSVPVERECSIKDYINDFVKTHSGHEFGTIIVYSYVDRFLID